MDARKCEIGRETERNYKEERKRGEGGRRDREGMYDTANSKIIKIERILMQ